MENQFTKRPNPHHTNDLCSKFQRGVCDYGNNCTFTHSNEEIKRFSNQLIPLDENANPRCSSVKTKLCWRFMNGDKCPFGETCHFIHVRSGGRSVDDENGEMQQQQQQQEGRKVCQWRTKLCNKWMATGSCRYGGNCCFAHGESELQNQGPCKLVDTKMEGKQLKVKWINRQKINGIYADWINDNDMSLVSYTI